MIDRDVFRHALQLPLMIPSLLVPTRRPVQHKRDDGHPPLVFVHGLGGARGNFVYLGGYLAMTGRRRRYAIQFDAGTDIAERAQALVEFVREVRAVTGADEVDLVAHSLGGLIARVALTEVGFARQVRTIVTLGSPHAGTFSARFAGTVLTRAIRRDADTFSNLGPPPPGVRAISLWSRNDLLVLPPESAAWPGAEHVEVSPFTHYSYLLEPRGFRIVGRLLDGLPEHQPAVA